jgi:CRP-like cAMP-binding protein
MQRTHVISFLKLVLMITSKVKDILQNIIQFSEDEYKFIEPYFEPVVLKKNQTLLEEGQLCNAVFLVESGLLRNYYDNDGLDVNLSFTLENQFTTNFEAYINQEPSKISIQAIEKSEVWIIKIRDIPRGKGSFANLSTFIRRVAIRILFATEEHHNMIMMNSPVDRYRYLLEKKPELIQRIPLTHLASYIGITRETLSRIRSNKY